MTDLLNRWILPRLYRRIWTLRVELRAGERREANLRRELAQERQLRLIDSIRDGR